VPRPQPRVVADETLASKTTSRPGLEGDHGTLWRHVRAQNRVHVVGPDLQRVQRPPFPDGSLRRSRLLPRRAQAVPGLRLAGSSPRSSQPRASRSASPSGAHAGCVVDRRTHARRPEARCHSSGT
jgi:hypothetical protein